jgi:hypothetical protein
MTTSSVPAQITTIEDKIAGNLSLKQLILLTTPIFLDILIYAVFPSSLHFSAYKIALMLILNPVFLVSAIRVRDQIILTWLVILIRYNSRPACYVFNKNDIYLRESSACTKINRVKHDEKAINLKPEVNKKHYKLTDKENILLDGMLYNPKIAVRFISHRKAGLSVHITESK